MLGGNPISGDDGSSRSSQLRICLHSHYRRRMLMINMIIQQQFNTLSLTPFKDPIPILLLSTLHAVQVDRTSPIALRTALLSI